MAKLIKLTFDPLYPVCEGELIFFTVARTDSQIKEAIADIKEIYLRWLKLEDITVIYLGEFEPAYENQFENSVISYQDGDY